VKQCCRIAVLAMFGVLASSSGCLSLSMLNRENGDTKQRLDSLEQRVSTLEAGRVAPMGQPMVVPGQPTGSTQSSRAIPLSDRPAGYP